MKYSMGAAIAAVVIAVAAIGAPAFADRPKSEISESDAAVFDVLMKQGYDKLQARDWTGAKENFELALDQPVFGKLSAERRYQVYLLAALAEMYSSDADKAYQHMIDAGTVAPDARDVRYWGIFCDVAQRAKKPDMQADAFLHIVTGYPDKVKTLDGRFVSRVVADTRKIKDGHVKLLAVLEALHAAKYQPPNIFWTGEWIDYSLMTVYAEKGDDARASAIAATLTGPGSIKGMQIDRRYSRFVSPDTAAFVTANEKNIARLKALADAHPDKLEGVQSLASALMTANRLPEALQTLDGALGKVTAAPKDKPAFSDQKDQLNWIYDTRSRVLRKMGRFDDALAALKQGRDAAEAAGEDIVSQKINLGDELIAMGRAKEALEEVKTLDAKDASPYGVMSATEARACAYAQLGDAAHLKTEMDYMTAHADDGAGPLETALLCAGDLDALAARFIARLDDPDERASALDEVQTYLEPEKATPWRKTIGDRYEAMLKRPDVKAVIDKYGFIRSYPVFGSEF